MMSKERRAMIGWRLAQVVPVLLLVTFFSFLLLHLSPVDPAVLLAGENPTPAQIHTGIHGGAGCPQPNHANAKNPSTATVTPRSRPAGKKLVKWSVTVRRDRARSWRSR